MRICKTRNDLKEYISETRASGKSIGFVPTMGALHEGHLSLVERSRSENDCTVVSIFVNPLQFNNPDDFEKYPVDTQTDLSMLEAAGTDTVFLPQKEELYDGYNVKNYDLGLLDSIMEGAFRPGHFNGVANVVSLLFSLVSADKSYFGEKDYQQIAVIRRMAVIDGYQTEIIACPTVRDKSGLALSSRNRRLTEQQVQGAATVSRYILGIAERPSGTSKMTLQNEFNQLLNTWPGFKPEYFELVDSETLESLEIIPENRPARAVIAYYAGEVRLIDNCSVR